MFTVAGVPVDVTAETAAKARDAALIEGHRAAYDKLLRRLTLRRDHGRLPKLSDGQIAELVQGFEVADEKTSRVRYLARLTVRFKAGQIRGLLRGHGLTFAETRSKPILVMPVYRWAGTLLLWDNPNPWRDAWSALNWSSDVVPLILPRGDLADIADINAEQAVAGVADRLNTIAARYGAADTVVAQATRRRVGRTSAPVIDVSVARLSKIQDGPTIIDTVAGSPGASLDKVMARAVQMVAVEVEESWKRRNLLKFDHRDRLLVTAPLGSLADLVALRRQLDQVAAIVRSELVSLSRASAAFDLQFIGDAQQLRLALAQSDLNLSQDETGWVLRFSTAKTGPQGPTARQ